MRPPATRAPRTPLPDSPSRHARLRRPRQREGGGGAEGRDRRGPQDKRRSQMNKLIQRGNLGGSPVLKTKGEVVYARFSYAVNVLDRDGNRTPQWWPAVAFSKLAQTLGQLQKGDEILVEGEPRETRYTKDGVEHRAFENRVQRVEFLRLKPRTNGDDDAAPQEEPGVPEAGEDHFSDPGPE